MTKVVAELPDELIAIMKRLARQLGITEQELLAQGLQQYCQTLESDFKAIGFGMWQEREDLQDSAQWVPQSPRARMAKIKVLDTDVLVDYFRGVPVAKDYIQHIPLRQRATTDVTLLELFRGAQNKKQLNTMGQKSFAPTPLSPPRERGARGVRDLPGALQNML